MSSERRQKTKARLTINLHLPFGVSSITLDGLSPHLKITALKTRIEQDVGILSEMYHLTYIDAAPLEDHTSLQYHDVINGATVTLRPWRIWSELCKSAYVGNAKECLSCSAFSEDSKWSRHCAWCALYVAAHRGHYSLVAKLLETKLPAINSQSPCGWTALHAAARMGQWKVLCILVDKGADIRISDSDSMTAFDLSRKHAHKKCEQSLNFCQWNLQKHQIVKERKEDYDAAKARTNATRQAHQYRDSTLSTWFKGSHGQMYMEHIPNLVSVGEVQKFERERKLIKDAREKHTSRLSHSLPSIKSTSLCVTTTADSAKQTTLPSPSESDLEEEIGRKLDFKYGWFDPLRAQQLIPPTHDVLTYANPSSCQLRPRSVLNPGGYTTKLHHSGNKV